MRPHLVVDHGRLWIPPDVRDRAHAQLVAIHAETSPRVRAWRAKHEGSGADRAAEPADLETRGEAATDPPRRSPYASPAMQMHSDGGRWLLAVPYVAAAIATAAGYGLAILFGGVR